MQNNKITFELTDNSVDKYVLINPTKQQFFSVAKEESQMFPSADYNFSGVVPSDYTNDPNWQTENRDIQISTTTDTHLNASFMPLDYIGMSNYNIPVFISELFSDIKLYDVNNGSINNFYASSGNLQNISNGVQLMKIPANIFNTTLTDPVAIANNGGSNILNNYNSYYILVSPKYVQSTISQITPAVNYEFSLNYLNTITIGGQVLPAQKRRRIYSCPNEDFKLLPWNFEAQPNQAGRLLGSVIEIWDSTATVLKQTKIVNENDLNFTETLAKFVISPDNVGYDPIEYQTAPGDVVRIYPRETYFNQFILEVNYVDNTKTIKAALEFMLNDVARNMSNGIYEVYDDAGVTVDTAGNFEGNVIQKYQISQYGIFELRKKLKN